MIDHIRQMPAEAREQFVARQAALRRNGIDLIGAQGAGKVVRRNLLVRSRTHPRIGDLALAILLELPEQIAEPAADHASRGAACEQAAQSALEQIAKTSTHSAAGHAIARRWRRCRRYAGLAATEMFDRLPGEQCQHRHGDRRHAAARWRARIARAARALLHPVEYIE